MLTITLNLTTAATQRLQEAVERQNQVSGTTFTAEQWVIIVLKQAIIGTCMGKFAQEQQAPDAATFGAQLETDVEIT